MRASMLMAYKQQISQVWACLVTVWFCRGKSKISSKLNWDTAKPPIEGLEFHRQRLPRSASSWQLAPSVLISAVSDRAAANQRSDIRRLTGVEAGTKTELCPISARRIRTIPPTIFQEPMRFGSRRRGRGMACVR